MVSALMTWQARFMFLVVVWEPALPAQRFHA